MKNVSICNYHHNLQLSEKIGEINVDCWWSSLLFIIEGDKSKLTLLLSTAAMLAESSGSSQLCVYLSLSSNNFMDFLMISLCQIHVRYVIANQSYDFLCHNSLLRFSSWNHSRER